MNQPEAKVISLVYELRQSNPDGELIEMVNIENPAVFLFGLGQLVPKFEESVIKLEKNDKFEFTVSADEAYGLVNPSAIVALPKSTFVIDGKLAEDMLNHGNVINMQDQDGNPLRGKIIEINEETVKMDFNHPLAGIDLHFKGEVIETRPASSEEIDHGHVHHGDHAH